MLQDEDKRVIPAVLSSLARLKAPDLRAVLLQRLEDPDFVVRATAARELGTLKPEGGAEALRQAYKTASSDSAYTARTAALDALVAYGAAESATTLTQALDDKDWAVRVRADELLAKLDAEQRRQRAPIAPVPVQPVAPYDDPGLIGPTTSPHVFIETAYGTIEFELAVLDAPQTSRSFIELVRKGFFNGLEVHRVVANFVMQYGDPRGDGEGGPGYTIRDELNERPYLRGTVGMALDVARHGRQPVLHHALTAAAPRRPIHGVRPCRQRHGGGRSDQAGRRDSADSGVGRVGLGGVALSGNGVWFGPEVCTVHRAEARCTVDWCARATASCRPSSSRPWLLSWPLCLSPLSLVGFCLRGAVTALQRRGHPARRPASVSTPSPLCRTSAIAEGVHQ